MLGALNQKLHNLKRVVTRRHNNNAEELGFQKQADENQTKKRKSKGKCRPKSECENKEVPLWEQILSLKKNACEKEAEIEELKKELKTLRDICDNQEALLNEKYKNSEESDDISKQEESNNDDESVYSQDTFCEENIEISNSKTDIDKLIEEVNSLRIVLSLKQDEIKTMRVALTKLARKEEELRIAETRARLVNAKCEDLQEQLRLKCISERILQKDISTLKKMKFEDSMQRRPSIRRIKSPPKMKRVIKKRTSIGYVLDVPES